MTSLTTLVQVTYNYFSVQITELMSSAVRDLTESEFVGQRDQQNNPLPTNPLEGSPVDEWTLRSELSGGRLLGKSCEGTLRLAGHSKEFSKEGYKFGKHLALAWQVSVRPCDNCS